MRRLALTLCALLSTACGDYSNLDVEDLAFVRALPRAGDLKVETAGEVEMQQALGSSETGLERPARVCGGDGWEPFCDGTRLAIRVNVTTAALLSILDAVRELPPSERHRDARRWGPFDDHSTGRKNRVTVQRHEADGRFQYEWLLETLAPAASAGEVEWVTVLHGSFVPGRSGTAAGIGVFEWDGASLRSRGLERPDGREDRVEIRYDLARRERHLEADIEGRNEREDPYRLALAQTAGGTGAGWWRYTVDGDVFDRGVEDRVEVRARWRADRAGRADAQITLGGGAPAGPHVTTECWNERLAQTFFDSDIEQACGTAGCPRGNVASCVFDSLFAGDAAFE